MAFRRRLLALSLGGWLAIGCIGCGGAASQPTAPAAASPGGATEANSTSASEAFHGERAWSDLKAIAGVGPRPPGSEAAGAARRYITEALEGVGLEVAPRSTRVDLSRREALELTHLSVQIPGASPDRFVLVSAYDSDHFAEFANPGVNLGASGAALLIELARALSASEPAYTMQILFLEGQGRLGIGEHVTAERRGLGGELLARQMDEAGELDGVRLLIAFRGVCDADLAIARDLLSNRHYREEFWSVARDLGYEEIFRRDAPFESVEAAHRGFLARGLRSVLAVADTAYGGAEPPGLYANSAQDRIERCSSESLRIVGEVTLRALERIGARLDRIDRFAARPLDGGIGASDPLLERQGEEPRAPAPESAE